MDHLNQYREIACRVLNEHAQRAAGSAQMRYEVITDTAGDHYLLMVEGWEERRRIHGCIIHIDLIDGKLWVQRDGTDYGVANALWEAGVPKENIVLGYKSPELRQYTEFAAA